MNNIFDDEKLAAYALGELDDTERASVEIFVNEHPEAQQTVAEFRAAAELAAEAMQVAPVAGLDAEQRERLRAEARRIKKYPLRLWIFTRRDKLGALAAVLFVAVGLAILIPAMTPARESARRSSSLQNVSVGGAIQMRGNWADQKAPAGAMGGYGGGMGGYGGGMGAMGGYGGRMGEANAPKDVNGNGNLNLSFYARPDVALEQKVAAESVSAPAMPAAPEAPVASTTPLPQPDRYLIKTATISIETEDAQESAKQLTASVVAAGGYVSDLHQQTDGMGRHNVVAQVRVPADKLDGTMEALDALGKVLDRQVSTQDVSEEYVDTDARIRNLKKTEERLLEHLSQAILIDSTLKIEQELTRVREQLERLEGRQRFLNNRIQYSTITIMLSEEPKAGPLTPVNTFSSGRVFSDAAQSLVAFARGLWTKAIWLAVWSPVWGALALVGWMVYRRVRKAINR